MINTMELSHGFKSWLSHSSAAWLGQAIPFFKLVPSIVKWEYYSNLPHRVE